MPKLLPDGFPEPATRSRFDFTEWANGEVWSFIRGEDYTSSTDSFRYNVKRWAKARGYAAELQTIAATDERGHALPATKAEPVGVAVRFQPISAHQGSGRTESVRLRDASPRAA
jgi:hypothetical protein